MCLIKRCVMQAFGSGGEVRASCRSLRLVNERVWSIGGMTLTGGKPSTGRNPFPSATFSPTSYTWLSLGLKSGSASFLYT